MALDKPLDQITEDDLQALIQNQVSELKTLEYKQSFPGTSDSERKEFLADVSSFANASGGHLIYGMKARDGVPVELCGVEEDWDLKLSALESSIRDGIKPRLPGVHTVVVKLKNSLIAIIIRIPKSYASPHMVTYKNTSRFFSRASNGKYQLDVDEIRAAFLLSETIADRIRDFRLERIARIQSGETPVPLFEGAKIALHLIPLSAFNQPLRLDLASVHPHGLLLPFSPIYHSTASDYRYNFDGILIFRKAPEYSSAAAYLQLFRTGAIETVDAIFLQPYEEALMIASLDFERSLFQKLATYFSTLGKLGIEPPLFLALSLLGVRGYAMSAERYRRPSFGSPKIIDRDAVLPPVVLIDSFEPNLTQTLKPLLDSIWNASGWPGSIYYKDGEWIGGQL